MMGRVVERARLAVVLTLLLAPLGVLRAGTVKAQQDGPPPFTAEELSFLQGRPVVRIGLQFMPPFVIFNQDDGPASGLIIDYLGLLSEALGVTFQPVMRTRRDTNHLMQALQRGEIDMIPTVFGEGPPPWRRWIAVTEPVLELPVAVVTRSDRSEITDYDQLAGLKVVALGAVADRLREMGLSVEPLRGLPHIALRGVETGEFDAFVGELPPLADMLSRMPSAGLRLNGELPMRQHLTMAVRARHAALARLLEKGFARISLEQRGELWRKWVRLPEPVTIGNNNAMLYWGGGAGLLVLVVLPLIWVRYGRRAVPGIAPVLDQHIMRAELDAMVTITDVTDALARALGYDGAELVGRPLLSIAGPANEDEEELLNLWSGLQEGRTWKGEFKITRRDGSPLWAEAVVFPRRRRGEMNGFTVMWQDVTERTLYRDLSLKDELTGLNNRRAFNDIVPARREAARAAGACFALLVVDVDYFKKFNDTYGHGRGDEVLAEVGRVLGEAARRESDDAFRLGGEEFGLILTVSEAGDALPLAEGVRRAIAALAIPHSGNPPGVVTASIGFAVAKPDDDRPVELLLEAADQALYAAKDGGRNRVEKE